MKLEFIGRPGPHRNMPKFIEQVRHRRPSATPVQIERYAHYLNAKNRPRHSKEIYQLFGRDIMSEDLESIDAWPHIPKEWKKILKKLPLHSGNVIRAEDGASLQRLLFMKRYNEINRASVCVPPGLSRTYVWCRANQWIEDVSIADADIIRRSLDLYPKFRPVDNADNPQIIQKYARIPDGDPIIGKTRGDVEDIARELGIIK